jgi:NADPH2:quinone reductase
MKSIRIQAFGEPEVMELKDIPDPAPGPGQVLVRIHAAGVNPVDTYIRSGMYHIKPDLPYTPGVDGAGIVESVGEGVTGVRPEQRVHVSGSLSGTYAEKVLCETQQVHPLPDHLTFEQGAAVGIPYAAACYALFHRARAAAGETVLIHGATGGVGTAAVQFAVASGMTVMGTGGTEEGRDMVLAQGAHHVLDHHDPAYRNTILELTMGRGVDVVLEMLANVNLGNDLALLAPNGRIVVIGSRGTVEIDPRDAMTRNAEILGMIVMNASEEEQTKIRAAIATGLRNGDLRPVVGKELPLADAPRAHHMIMESRALGKIVLKP